MDLVAFGESSLDWGNVCRVDSPVVVKGRAEASSVWAVSWMAVG